MAQGAGGELMDRLLEDSVLKKFTKGKVGAVGLADLDDGASLEVGDFEVIVSTDGHTVNPVFFPGGDIGSLAACGTMNDISVMGTKPVALTSSIILEEGFLISDLEKILLSMNESCDEVGTSLIAGDTKVMETGALDKIVITTTGLGITKKENIVRDSGLKVGDKIIISGTVGDHGISLMSFREGFGFETKLKSDVAPVWDMVEKALRASEVHAMKDPTRGGLAAALNEFARKSGVGILVKEEDIPLKDEVISASEMLGLDPFMVANEGKVVFGVTARDAVEVLKAIKSTPIGKEARICGEVIDKYRKKVILETSIGGKKIMEMPVGDPVPRVC
ncbi:MAG: hydrogenase expression/formation protein HypE [Candidatus Hydrothermarchaeales archaeon]